MSSLRYNLARFELVEPLFDSCFGTLWEAKGRVSNARALVRVIPGDKLNAEERDGVLEAARAAVGVEDDNFVSVIEVEADGEAIAVVSAFTDGLPLRSLLRAVREGEATLEMPVVLRIAGDMLAAVAAHHERGTDEGFGGLGPDAFLVGTDGRTRWMEVGLAPVLRRAKALAQNPERIGYDAPEVFQLGVKVDASADVFSVAAMLWEMLSEERLLAGTLPQLVAKLRKGALPRADAHPRRSGETVPAEVADVVQRALELVAADRLASPAEMANQLRAAEPAFAGRAAVAKHVNELLPQEIERVRQSHSRREEISQRVKSASDRPPNSEPPAPTAKPVAKPLVMSRDSLELISRRMDAPRSLIPLWIALAVGLVAIVGYFTTRERVLEPAHYIMQVVRPPVPPEASASASASASAEPSARRSVDKRRKRRVSPSPSPSTGE